MASRVFEREVELFRQHGVGLRMAEALRLGINRKALYAMRDAGVVVPVSRGVGSRPESGGWQRWACGAGRNESVRVSRLASRNHLDSQAFAFPGRCERSEPVPPRALRTG